MTFKDAELIIKERDQSNSTLISRNRVDTMLKEQGILNDCEGFTGFQKDS